MRTTELESHLQAHWEKIRAKLLAGSVRYDDSGYEAGC
jgi:hypothetical protein